MLDPHHSNPSNNPLHNAVDNGMAYSRAHSSSITSNTPHTPHTLSLKVLRLSRPSLAPQTSLPSTDFVTNDLGIPSDASLAYPHSSHLSQSDENDPTASFPLVPLLTLPAQFGAAYVGETFTCTLCANNEAPDEEGKDVDENDNVDGLPSSRGSAEGPKVKEGKGSSTEDLTISDVQISAYLQTPGQPTGIALVLHAFSDDEQDDDGNDNERPGEKTWAHGTQVGNDVSKNLTKGQPLQLTLRHELKEQGAHVLAVTVTYSESRGEGPEKVVRKRTFRKLYQFVAQQLVVIRSKVTERSKGKTRVRGRVQEGEKGRKRQWVLEAQLENVGEASVVLERMWVREREGIVSRSCGGSDGRTVLKPQDVQQVMFLLETGGTEIEELYGPGRITLAQLGLDWRSAMGEKGSLSTGWLASKAS